MKRISSLFLYSLTSFVLVSGTFAKTLPQWIDDPSTACDADSICAVGTGASLKLAKTDAKNNIQKYFETKVDSSFTNRVYNDNKNVVETADETIAEETSGILKGVEIKKTFKNGNEFFALASLNKNLTITELKLNIDLIDKQMLVLVDDDSAASAKKLETLFYQREGLNKKYAFLNGRKVPEYITYEEVFNKRKNVKNRNITILFKSSLSMFTK